MHVRAAVGLCFCAAVLAAMEPSAKACSPPLPGVYQTLPADGETYAGNASIFFWGYDLNVQNLVVTVDGQPATWTMATNSNPSTVAIKLDQPALEGQAVAVSGDPCNPGAGCSPVALQFTAGAADVDEQSGAKAWFDVYDYPDYIPSPGDCTSNSDLAYWVHIRGNPPPNSSESPVIYTVQAKLNGNVVAEQSVFAQQDLTNVAFRVSKQLLAGADAAEALCFSVNIADAAGNQGIAVLDTCSPCHYRVEAGPTPLSPPPEPTWTSADAYPEGVCENGVNPPGTGGGGGAGGSGTGGSTANDGTDASSDSGCSCEVAGGSDHDRGAAGFWAVALTLLVLRKKERAARRMSQS